MSSHGRSCATCDHWVPRPEGDGLGECHESPPMPIVVVKGPEDFRNGGSLFPELFEDDWCARWKAAEAPENNGT